MTYRYSKIEELVHGLKLAVQHRYTLSVLGSYYFVVALNIHAVFHLLGARCQNIKCLNTFSNIISCDSPCHLMFLEH